MSFNGLTGAAGLKLGPLVLETLVKHYFERLKATHRIPATKSSDGVVHDGKQGESTLNNNLRQEELLYDQAFTIVKVSITRVSSPRLRCSARVCGLRGSRAFVCLSLAVLCNYPLLIRAILSFHHHVAAFRNSCRLLLGKTIVQVHLTS